MLRTVSVLLLCVTVAGAMLYLTNQPAEEIEQVSYKPRDKDQRFQETQNSSRVADDEESLRSQALTSNATNAVTVFDEKAFQNSHDSLLQIVEAYNANLTDPIERQLLEQKFAEQSDAYKQQVLARVKSQN